MKGAGSFSDAVPPYYIYEPLSPPYSLVFIPIYLPAVWSAGGSIDASFVCLPIK
ncbi:hypothetical protein FXV91_03580 [Methanosarcina sp. DH2]|uniref:hypothetical protein n=1 Tax=Methanosarcina sp. DH2 TaxID=2605639 RepID=UPI001E5F625A|nr:hypothetical protein [Methanosarcina sp. DH2]MCC4769313.1 hypothetical protein [Methanosarcina sp. DH2]